MISEAIDARGAAKYLAELRRDAVPLTQVIVLDEGDQRWPVVILSPNVEPKRFRSYLADHRGEVAGASTGHAWDFFATPAPHPLALARLSLTNHGIFRGFTIGLIFDFALNRDFLDALATVGNVILIDHAVVSATQARVLGLAWRVSVEDLVTALDAV